MLENLCLLVERSVTMLPYKGSSPLRWVPAKLKQHTQLFRQLQWYFNAQLRKASLQPTVSLPPSTTGQKCLLHYVLHQLLSRCVATSIPMLHNQPVRAIEGGRP